MARYNRNYWKLHIKTFAVQRKYRVRVLTITNVHSIILALKTRSLPPINITTMRGKYVIISSNG